LSDFDSQNAELIHRELLAHLGTPRKMLPKYTKRNTQQNRWCEEMLRSSQPGETVNDTELEDHRNRRAGE
jgi:hypothetical protein